VDHGGNIVLADYCNRALRKVSKAGAVVSMLAAGVAARYNSPAGLGLLAACCRTGTWWWRTRATTRSGW
jgi:hypothetical protein